MGVSGDYGIITTSDGVVYMCELSRGSKLYMLHRFQGMLQYATLTCILVTLHTTDLEALVILMSLELVKLLSLLN